MTRLKLILAILMLLTTNVTAAPAESLAYAEQIARESQLVRTSLSNIMAVELEDGSISVAGFLEQGNKDLIRSIMIDGVDIAIKVAEKYPSIPNCMFLILTLDGDIIAGIGAYNYARSSASSTGGQGTYITHQAPTTKTTSSASPQGGRENPIPRETWVDLSDGWSIKVCCSIPDATRAVLNENMFNSPPKTGHQFFLTKVTACYKGTGSSKFDGSFRLRAVGDSSVAYSTFENSCGVIPEQLPNPEVFSGGCIEGYVGWQIKSSDARSLVMYDSPLLGSSSERVYFKILP